MNECDASDGATEWTAEHYERLARQVRRRIRAELSVPTRPTSARMLVFLDIDGVLRRDGAALWQFESVLLDRFETMLRSLAQADVVISSGWREVFPLSEIREHFSPDIRSRIIGGTPISSSTFRQRTPHYRHREVAAFLKRPQVLGLPWVALDDEHLHYPPWDNVRILDGARGLDDADVTWLLAMAQRYGGITSRR